MNKSYMNIKWDETFLETLFHYAYVHAKNTSLPKKKKKKTTEKVLKVLKKVPPTSYTASCDQIHSVVLIPVSKPELSTSVVMTHFHNFSDQDTHHRNMLCNPCS